MKQTYTLDLSPVTQAFFSRSNSRVSILRFYTAYGSVHVVTLTDMLQFSRDYDSLHFASFPDLLKCEAIRENNLIMDERSQQPPTQETSSLYTV